MFEGGFGLLNLLVEVRPAFLGGGDKSKIPFYFSIQIKKVLFIIEDEMHK